MIRADGFEAAPKARVEGNTAPQPGGERSPVQRVLTAEELLRVAGGPVVQNEFK